MDDALVVSVLHRLGDLHDRLSRLARREWTGGHLLCQALALHEAHAEIVLTSRKKARERGIVGSLKPFRWNPAGNQSRPVEPDQQPEASLAWWVGDHPYEA